MGPVVQAILAAALLATILAVVVSLLKGVIGIARGKGKPEDEE